MQRKQKLELTWIGKEERPKLEPRILLEDPAKSYHAARRVRPDAKLGEPGYPGDLFDNRLIFGDNLLALKALESEFTGKIKCIYIDPPFNTGSAFEHYDDGVEHSQWLSLMRDRLERLRALLTRDGLLFVHLDDCEMAYAKVLLDEIFGRFNYCNTIAMTTNDPSGFKATGATVFSTANYVLVYARDKSTTPLKKVFIEKPYDTAYSKVLADRSAPYTEWSWDGINEVVARELGFDSVRAAKREVGDSFEDEVARFAIRNADRVFQTAAIGGGAAIKRDATIKRSMRERERVFVHPGEDMPDFYILNGRQILFYDKRLLEIDGKRVPGEVVTDVWTDISWNGISNEGGVEFKNGKKPELLIKRVLEMSTSPGDWVLDSFAGSGTTGAVAHKMGRRWIMVELGEHCHTHIIPRLMKVIDGEDKGGVTEATRWKGGGGFRYYRLAPSLLEKDRWGNWVISKEYNAAMLAEALCKLEGFTYAPSDTVYWQHGHSTERDFIYVTTQPLTRDMLAKLSDEVGEDRTLLIMCKAFTGRAGGGAGGFPNLTIKKIPKAVMAKCEWGRDDYSLEIKALPPPTQPEPEAAVDGAPAAATKKPKVLRGSRKPKGDEPGLFPAGAASNGKGASR
ncbi:MAG: hypothetical protein HBSAPP03_02930 [Phycisphaerae bacterium]|nr:MAG: hypothetical protein HBSAPP03_02930 [Phycisphaerae bacterium]